jgi:hypothetical protein
MNDCQRPTACPNGHADAAAGLSPAAVGPTGGRVSRLSFAVVGDTRPALPDDTADYPSEIIGTIYERIESLAPRPPFALATGDYVFATTGGGQAAPQFDLYLLAARRYSGVVFPAMGNHECTGATASNCGPGAADGTPDNYLQFVEKMLRPIGRSVPYFAFDVDSIAGTWSAKFVVVAGNAWDDVQARWLAQTLARSTTYTFVVRHEPAAADRAPGVTPSEQILAESNYTLSIVGHSHTYARSGPREVIIGNGGAPLTSSSATFGFGLVRQRDDGAIQVDVIDSQTMQVDADFAFAIAPDGSALP